jgi:hypothetical protein
MVQIAQCIGTATLEFDPAYALPDKPLADSLSAVLWLPEGNLFVAADETATLEHLQLSGTTTGTAVHFAHHQQLALADVLQDFKGVSKKGKVQEIDLEGLAYCEPYLWFVGSHSVKRKKPKAKSVDILRNPEDLERLATVIQEPNRYLLGRIRLRQNSEGQLQFPDPASLSPEDAAYLERTADGNLLLDALKADPHLGPILTTDHGDENIAYPGKDNGFDIEGIVVKGDHIFLGLRGPVLRGWSLLLEVAIEASAPGFLRLKPLGPQGEYYRKHFLNLKGLGIRDLCISNNDLLILAGPTMNLDGPVYLFCLKGGLDLLQSSDASTQQALEILREIPVGVGTNAGYDHPEGLTLVPQEDIQQVLVVYDAPAAPRKGQGTTGTTVAIADIFAL